jgi:hypothetical protein
MTTSGQSAAACLSKLTEKVTADGPSTVLDLPKPRRIRQELWRVWRSRTRRATPGRVRFCQPGRPGAARRFDCEFGGRPPGNRLGSKRWRPVLSPAQFFDVIPIPASRRWELRRFVVATSHESIKPGRSGRIIGESDAGHEVRSERWHAADASPAQPRRSARPRPRCSRRLTSAFHAPARQKATTPGGKGVTWFRHRDPKPSDLPTRPSALCRAWQRVHIIQGNDTQPDHTSTGKGDMTEV